MKKLKYLDKSFFIYQNYCGYQDIPIHVYINNGELFDPKIFNHIGYRDGDDIDCRSKKDSIVVYSEMITESGIIPFWFHLFKEIDTIIMSRIGVPIKKIK